MSNQVINTIVFPIIRTDFILPALESLRQNTPQNYRTIVVNQSMPNREFEEKLYSSCDYVIRPHHNLGFAMAANLGVRLSPTPWVMVCNDDTLFINPSWWDGVMATFERFPKACAANSMSTKEPGWGWGEPGYRHLVPKSFMSPHIKPLYDVDRKRMLRVKELKKKWDERAQLATSQAVDGLWKELEAARRAFQGTQGELEELVLRLSMDPAYIEALIEEKNWMVVDAFACWATVFKADVLEEIGSFDERFRDGGGEDYDFMSRAYGAGYRCLSTSASWIHHFWGQSKDSPSGFGTALPSIGPQWNCLSTKGFGDQGLWDPDLDCWGRTGTRTDPNVFRHHLQYSSLKQKPLG